jgi:hypothetical protein
MFGIASTPAIFDYSRQKSKTELEFLSSMPTYFVGNRFNTSSKTEIYIPSWKDKKDVQKNIALKSSANESPSSTSCTTSHSTFCESLTPVESTIGTLSRDVSPFKNHSLNSDKKLQRHSGRSLSQEQAKDKKCVSYQFLQISKSVDLPEACCCTTVCKTDPVIMDSVRSSDSGMASYTISSPDHKNSRTSHNISCFEYHTAVKVDCCEVTSDRVLALESSESLDTVRLKHSMHESSDGQFQYSDKSGIVINLLDADEPAEEEDFHDTTKVYKTGLYVHWWKKEKLPDNLFSSRESSSNSVMGAALGGSGKISLPIY